MLLGRLQKTGKSSLPRRAVAGAGVITCVELLTGLIANRNFTVWDYRQLPANFMGQICLPYSLLWVPVGLGGMFVYRQLDRWLPQKQG